MASFNRVVIMGNLGQDPELRYTPNQAPVCTLSVATTDYRTGADGQRVEQTEWHRVVVWNKQAENCQKYLAKGRSVLVEGRLQTRSWEDQKTGQKRYSTEIIAQTVQFVGGAAVGRDQRPAGPGVGPAAGGGYGSNNQSGGYASSAGSGAPSSYGGPSSAGSSQSPQDHGGRFDGDMEGGDFGGPGTPGLTSLDEIPF